MKATAVTPTVLIESRDHAPEESRRREKGGQDETTPHHARPVATPSSPFSTGKQELVSQDGQDRGLGLSVRGGFKHRVGIATRGQAAKPRRLHDPSPAGSPRSGASTPADRSRGSQSKTSRRSWLNTRRGRRVRSPSRSNPSSVQMLRTGASPERVLGPFPVRSRKHTPSPTKNAAASNFGGSGSTPPPLPLDANGGGTSAVVSPYAGATETTTAPSPALREKTAATLLKAKSPQSARSLDPVLKNLQCVVKCAVELSLLLAAVVTLTVWLHRNAAAPVTASSCSTEGCTAHASEFNGTLNYGVDPCVDMDAFVCSVWRSRGSGEDRSSLSLLAHVIREYEASVAEIFLTGRTEFEASRMATDFLRKCTQRQAAPSLDNFKHFFALSSLPWPFDVTESVDAGLRPLERVLNLSLMWDIDTWFRAYMNSAPAYESNTTGVLTLFVEASGHISFFEMNSKVQAISYLFGAES
ncbi:uncharacterized protein LOC142559312 [Dermacentor variabilis]|uniref:uncharacterized protein LOC142559312 n=1 Tax=Dermacentor variabilis TaxID=34621 RepID=UPI003F5B46D3